MTSGIKVPEVDIKQAKRILKAAKEYPTLKQKIESKIEYGLTVKTISEKNDVLRELRMML